ncbi:MAG TPA: hypothetical protein VLF89_08090 [Candidatus Saccharimonadales bacterium]|nr:hypothetical protein [Candidatus Saccharimonadales bacterium]
MKKNFIITWRIAVVSFAAVLFVQLFNTFGTSSDAVRVGRVTIPTYYIQQTDISTNQLTYK